MGRMKFFKSLTCKHKWKLVKVTEVTEILFCVNRYNKLTYKCEFCGKKKNVNDFSGKNYKDYAKTNLISYYEEQDKLRQKNKEVWHYTCENGHKWESYSSPRGTYVYGESGQTRCSVCGSTVTMGEVYINGKKTQMGAMHMAYGLKGKKKEKAFKEADKLLMEAQKLK